MIDYPEYTLFLPPSCPTNQDRLRIMPLTLADGKLSSQLTARGFARVESEDQVGTIVLGPPESLILVGMEFLRAFKKKLIIDPTKSLVIFEDS